jgi:pimeloyl-ACP methyl ester carboxylesterase
VSTTVEGSRPIRPLEPVVAADGLRIARAEGRGSGEPGVLAVHGTGFCKELWGPFAESLVPRRLVAFDQRGHGDSGLPEPPFDWWDLGTDVLAVVAAGGPRRPVGLGHSSGGTALLLAEMLRPGTFLGLVLVEPVVFPGPAFRAEENPMSAQALRRRSSFVSPQEALESFRDRGLFARWAGPVLQAYVEHGFRQRGDRWVLKCSPQTEAEFYRGATALDLWERLREVSCPVLLVGGEESDSQPPPVMAYLAEQFTGPTLEIVPGATHFVPQEQPEVLAGIVEEFVLGLGTPGRAL